MAGRDIALIAVQIVILVLAILVRNSAAPMVAALAVGCLMVVWQNHRVPGATKLILQKVTCMVVVAVAFVGVLMLSASKDYLHSGRFTETVWHRIFVSLGLHPAWPFGNLREIYDCRRYIPEGLVPGTEDRNGHCILWHYAIEHRIPPDVVSTMTYGREYDAALRAAFFNILRLYPAETLETFLYIKPRYIFWSIGQSFELRFAGVRPALIWLLVAALGNLLVFALIPSPVSSSSGHMAVASATVLFAAFSTLPYIAVWAIPYTSADLLLLCIFGLGLALTTIIQWLRGLLPGASSSLQPESIQ
jgi:hypothetical protein